MKTCVVIPCYDHPATVIQVALAARKHGEVLVVDDGSAVPLVELPGCRLLRLERNLGKGGALQAGFREASKLGFSHAITMDADGQHFAEDIVKFVEAAQRDPASLVVGVRDFRAAGCPVHRRRSNALSTFWFRVETGVRLPDTQCGFRCYPLALTERLRTQSGGYAFELEFMVRCCWLGVPVTPVPVKCTYAPEQLRQSHFRPIRDLAHITLINIGLVFQSWFVPLSLRMEWSQGVRKSWRGTLREIFAENAHEPEKLAAAVGLGLFFGIAPIWGWQMVVAAAAAHFLRLNKTITLLASNISIPPMMPFILYGALALGHWMFTGHKLSLDLSVHQMTQARAIDYLGQWLAGSLALGAAVSLVGMLMTYSVARLVRKK